MTGRIKVGLVGIGNCFSGLIQGIEYYNKNPSQEVTGIIHDKLAGYGIHDIDFVCGFVCMAATSFYGNLYVLCKRL